MAFFDCDCSCRCRCPVLALVLSAIIGVLAAFFQITGLITVSAAFLWVVFGIGVVSLGVLLLTAALRRPGEDCGCICNILSTLLAAALGAVLLAVILLAFGITATSVLSAILVGLLLFFFWLTLTSAACLIRCLTGCGNQRKRGILSMPLIFVLYIERTVLYCSCKSHACIGNQNITR